MIYIKLTIAGTTYIPNNMSIDRTMSESNGVSSFKAMFNNNAGQYKTTFNLNDEIIVYADKDVNPAVTPIFKGVVEDIMFDGQGTRERLQIFGRDYTAILQDNTVLPIVYRGQETSLIVQSIMSNNITGITTNNVMPTAVTIESITFNHTNVFDALIELAEQSGFYFYVDTDKDLHFIERDDVSSGYTLNNTNILGGDFTNRDKDIYNSVWVYGTRILTVANDTFGATGGSVFTLSAKPHNVGVFVDDLLIQPGGIYQVDNPAYENVKYLVDYETKRIIFGSGLIAGDNVPTSGANVSVDYLRSTPIIKFVDDAASIAAYGKKVKVVVNNSITSYAQADDYADTFLAENKNPIIEGNLDLDGIIDLVPGETAIVNVPNHGINNQTYRIVSATYDFDKANCLANRVLRVTLNKRVDDLTDTIKDILLRIGANERADLEGEVSNLQQKTSDLKVEEHYEVYRISGTLYPFRFHFEGSDRLNSPVSVLGPWINGSIFLTSGGDF